MATATVSRLTTFTEEARAGATLSAPSWSMPGNAAFSNDSRSTHTDMGISPSSGTGIWLQGLNLVEAVPGDTVVGIEAHIERQDSGGGDATAHIKDLLIYLVIGGVIRTSGTNMANTTFAWPSSDVVRTYPFAGGSTDLWGLAPTVAQVNATDFGLVLAMTQTQTAGDPPQISTASVDEMYMTIYTEVSNGGGGNMMTIGIG